MILDDVGRCDFVQSGSNTWENDGLPPECRRFDHSLPLRSISQS